MGKNNRINESLGWFWHSFARGPIVICATAFLSPYIFDITKLNVNDKGEVNLLGISILASSYVALYATIAAFISAIISPILGALSDYSNHRKGFLKWSTLLGAFTIISSVLLIYTSLWWLGGIIFIICIVMYETSLIYIYAYLPEIEESDTKRSYLSVMGVVGTNVPQILFLIGISLVMTLSKNQNIFIKQGFYSNKSVQEWAIYSSKYTIQCQQEDINQENIPSCYRTTKSFNSGIAELIIRIPKNYYHPVTLVHYENLEIKKDGKIFFSVFISDEYGEDGKYNLRLDQNDKTGFPKFLSESEIFKTYKAPDYKLSRLKTTVPNDIKYIRLNINFFADENEHKYKIDDIELFNYPSLVRPILFVIVGLWWLGFGLFSMKYLRERNASHTLAEGENYWNISFVQIYKTLKKSYKYQSAFKFLIGYMFWNSGTSAVLSVMGIYLEEVMGQKESAIGIFYLCATIFGIVGAGIGHLVGSIISQLFTILITYVIWAFFPIYVYFFLHESSPIWVIYFTSTIVGLILGCNYTLNRSYFAGIIPEGQEGEYMGLYGFFSKIACWTSILIFAVVNEKLKSIEYAMLTLFPFFLMAVLFTASIYLSKSKDKNKDRIKKNMYVKTNDDSDVLDRLD